MILLLLACDPKPTSDLPERECFDACEVAFLDVCDNPKAEADDPVNQPLPGDCVDVVPDMFDRNEGLKQCPDDAATDTDPFWDSCHVSWEDCRDMGLVLGGQWDGAALCDG